MNITVTIILNPVISKKFNSIGSKKSVIAISLENLVSIVPIGFESKNITGALRRLQTILLWIFLEDITHDAATAKHLTKLNNI